MNKTLIVYSEAFKLKVVNELENGKFTSINEARECYGVKGGSTIQQWLRKYGKNNLLCKVVKVQTADEKSEIKKIKERNRKLEKALADAHLDIRIGQEYFKMVCEVANIDDPEEFKKKLNLR